MKALLPARFIFGGFLAIFGFAALYVLLDSLGLWASIPAPVSRAMEVLTGLILLGALVGHLVLATGKLPPEATNRMRS